MQAKHWIMQHMRHEPATRSVVVIVDDDPAVRNSLKFSLEIEGFVVQLYASGSELLSAGDISDCGCLVVDQKMPGMAGIDLIVGCAIGLSAPAILITSHPNTALAAVRRRQCSDCREAAPGQRAASTEFAMPARPATRDPEEPDVYPITRSLLTVALPWYARFACRAQDNAELEAAGQRAARDQLFTLSRHRPHGRQPPSRGAAVPDARPQISHRYLAEALAEGLSTGHPDMPEFVFEPQEINAILTYLQVDPGPKTGPAKGDEMKKSAMTTAQC